MTQKTCAYKSPIIKGYRLNPIYHSDSYGRIFAYEKTYDRITTKTEKPLQPLDRIKYNTTTSDDPVIQQVNISGVFVLSTSQTIWDSLLAKILQQSTRPTSFFPF